MTATTPASPILPNLDSGKHLTRVKFSKSALPIKNPRDVWQFALTPPNQNGAMKTAATHGICDHSALVFQCELLALSTRHGAR